MRIRRANKFDLIGSIKLAKSLKEWFTKEAIKNMKTDFSFNNLMVAVERSLQKSLNRTEK